MITTPKASRGRNSTHDAFAALRLFNERRDAQHKRWVPFLDFHLPGLGENVVSAPCWLYLQWCFGFSLAPLLTWTRRTASSSLDPRGVTSAILWNFSRTHPGKVPGTATELDSFSRSARGSFSALLTVCKVSFYFQCKIKILSLWLLYAVTHFSFGAPITSP